MKTLVTLAFIAMLGPPAIGQEVVLLPGGASTVSETHGDWVVRCEARQKQIGCALQQEQLDSNTGRRLLAIELASVAGTLNGSLVLPFGLALSQGVRLGIDENPPLPSVVFRTCLPVGCVVDVAFSREVIALLRTGTTLKVNAIADGGAVAPFNIPLRGLASALDRASTLTVR